MIILKIPTKVLRVHTPAISLYLSFAHMLLSLRKMDGWKDIRC